MKILLSVAFTFFTNAVCAQGWPSKPVRWIVPFPPGGSTDIAARAVGERVSQSLGQSILIENRVGAAGNIGTEFVAKSAPDGYTVLIAPDSITSNPHTYKNLGYQTLKDFVPVIQLTRQPIVLAAHPSAGVSSVAELVALAKAKPGLAFATSGAGSQQHMTAEWFAKLAGIQLTHVPYKGGGQAIADLVGGQVPIGSLGSSPSLPEVPTYEEAGYKGLVLDQWLGVLVPAGTPGEIVARLNAEIGKALADAVVRERFAQSALEAVGGSAEQFGKLMRDDYDKYARLVKELNIKIE